MADPREDRAAYHLRRLETMRSNRGTWDAHWEETAERLIPAHKNTFFGRSQALSRGQKNTEKMFDATASLALLRFAAVIESLATPKNQMWHRLVPADRRLRRNRQVRGHMDELNEILHDERYRPGANFVGQNQKAYQSYGAYGNGSVFVDTDEDRSGLRYKNIHLGEVYFDENHQGIVDTMYRAFRLKARQVIQMYGDKAVPQSVREAAKSNDSSETEYEILHAVTPRRDYNPRMKTADQMPFESIHILVQDKTVLRVSGYQSWPMPTMRYMQFVNETYGRGPAQWVLPAIKVLNAEKKTMIKQGHRVVDPVLLAYDDGQVGTFSLRAGALNPGGVNAQGRPLVHPLPTGNISAGAEIMDQERLAINDAFLVTLFQILVESHTMTATEVLERAREKGMLLAPTAGRLESEYLGPLIHRELDVLAQLGKLPAPPAALVEAGGQYTVEYDNPMARMVRSENAAGFMRALETALNIAERTGDPAPLDWFNFDESIPAIQEIHGAPVAWTNTVEAVQRIREGRAKEAQDQKMIEAAPAMAGAAKAMQGQGG